MKPRSLWVWVFNLYYVPLKQAYDHIIGNNLVLKSVLMINDLELHDQSSWSLWPAVLFMTMFEMVLLANHRVSADNNQTWRNVIKWKHFPRYWPFVREIHRSQLWCFLDLRLNKRLSKQSRSWWSETPPRSLWRQCNNEHRLQFWLIHPSNTYGNKKAPWCWRGIIESVVNIWYHREIWIDDNSHVSN